MDGLRQIFRWRWFVGQRSDLQLQRRQGQVRHEVSGQLQRQLWFCLRCPPEVSPLPITKGIQNMDAFCLIGLLVR